MTSTPEEWTIGKLLTWTADYLRKQGAESPRLDAELLLAHSRGCRRIELYTAFHEVVPEEIRAKFREAVRQRAQGRPVAYLIGYREFYSLTFHVTPDVLIPRPETEFLVLAMLDLLQPGEAKTETFQIADIGTGSGILAVCAAKLLPDSQVTAIDISPAALEVAKKNAAEHEVTDRIRFLEGDLLAPLDATRRLHLILSNPPYVSQKEFDELMPDVQQHEPRQALLGGPLGTEIIQRLITSAPSYLRPGGWLVMEVSPMIAARVAQALQEDDRYDRTEVRKDLAGHARVVLARCKT